jgi:hypothetical protein
MLNEYPQEFIDPVMKPSRCNYSSSDTIYQDTVIIPYVKGICEKFRRAGNRFNVRTVFKTKHTLCGILMETRLVRDAQWMKQCVFDIQCDCGKCYIGKQADL